MANGSRASVHDAGGPRKQHGTGRVAPLLVSAQYTPYPRPYIAEA